MNSFVQLLPTGTPQTPDFLRG